jgi:SAM-dependent methyltransferase
MKPPPHPDEIGFDLYATGYDADLAKGLAVSGESKDFFALGRVAWLARCLGQLNAQPQHVLDFGCGTGSSTPYLLGLNNSCHLTGVEVSPKSLEVARRQHGSARARFMLAQECQPNSDVDLAFCNGVFHHIVPTGRADAIRYVFDSLKPGGLFAFWENNPWNPGTRYVMSRIPFDRDAIPLSAIEAQRRLRAGGFQVLRTDFIFVFPKFLSGLRGIERHLAKLPFGAQYQVLCRKPF